MIVRDEAANLPRSLPSIFAVADEVVVCDTGSTDGTLDILRDFGCRVVHFQWCDDFAKARNVAISAAKGDYLFWVDADEEIRESEPGALRQACEKLPKDYHGYTATVLCPNDDTGLSLTQADQFRVWRNGMGLRFEGAVHEQLVPEGGPTYNRILPTNAISFFHWGYTARGPVLQAKWDRNRALLERQIQEKPHSYVPWAYMGRQYCWEERHLEALPYLREARKIFEQGKEPEDGLVHSIYSMLALCHHRLGNHQEAVEVARTCPPYGISSELEYLSGCAAALLGETSEAIFRLTRAYTDPSIFRRGVSDPATATWRPRMTLAEIAQRAGDYKTAVSHLEAVLAYNPELLRSDVRFWLIEYCLRITDDARASVHFQALLRAPETDLYRQRALSYLTGQKQPCKIGV